MKCKLETFQYQETDRKYDLHLKGSIFVEMLPFIL